MGFFKKIVDWFYEDVEEIVEIQEIDEGINPVQHSTPEKKKKKQKQNIEIEAKIQYHYPKNNFKFPMISDEELKILNERKKLSQQNIQVTGTNWTQDQEKVDIPFRPKTIQKQKSAPTPVTPKKNKRPFRRTEIPSPIYGFQRPKKEPDTTKDRVEYELSSEPSLDAVLALMRGDNKTAEPAVQSQTQVPDAGSDSTVQVSEEKAEQSKLNFDERPIDTDKGLALNQKNIQNNGASVNEQPINEVNVQSVGDNAVSEAVKEDSQLDEMNIHSVHDRSIEKMEMQDKSILIDQPLEIKVTEKQPSSVDVNEQSEVEPNRSLPVDHAEAMDSFAELLPMQQTEDHTVAETEVDEEEPSVEYESLSQPEEEVAATVIEEEIETKPIELENTSVLNQTMPEISNQTIDYPHETENPPAEKEEIVAEANKQEIEQLDVESLTEEERRKIERDKRIRERRKHIPFNVLMLKQDKNQAPRRDTSINQTIEPIEETQKKKLNNSFQFPSMSILKPKVHIEEDADWLAEQAAILDETLEQFNVKARVFAYSQGPSVTRFEVQPEPGVKVSKITNLSDDLKLSLAAKDIRIEAPIPGKRMIGIEIPNRNTRPVYLREIIEEKVFTDNPSPLTVAVGLDISGNPISTDLKKMPHGLVAGSTGSGKSVFINSVLISLLYKSDPSDVRLLLVDPKMVELAPYNNVPHLAAPVITDVKAATAALKWAVEEMDRRYELFAHSGARDIVRYNKKALEANQPEHKLPYLVIVIDELADLMMMSPADVEEAICRIAQKARACGIHLLVATQRPSVDVITGLIKANIPTRIAFSVSSQADSRTILDQGGAERLLGKGDMLFLENGTSKATRLQGTFVTDEEIEAVVEHVRHQAKPSFLFDQEDLMKSGIHSEEKDELYFEVCEFAVEMGGASISSLQRRFRIGYNRAARLIDMMEKEGILSESKGSKPRDVLISSSDLEMIQDSYTSS